MGVRNWHKNYPKGVNLTIPEPEKTIYQLLEETVAKIGEQTAIAANDETVTYIELKERIDKLASAWHRLGFKKGERIGIMLPNTPYYFYAYQAALKLGMIVVQINPYYSKRELLSILNDSGTTYIVVNEPGLALIEKVKDSYRFEHIFVDESNAKDYPTLNDLIKNSEVVDVVAPIDLANDVAVIQYTGGTTGKVKGAMLTHRNLTANIMQTLEIYAGKMRFGKETVLTATPLYHVYGMTSAMNFGIYIGGKNVLVEKYSVDHMLELIKEHQPTYFPGVPKMYNDFINHKDVRDYGLDCLKFCSCGSAPLPLEVIKRFEEITGAVITEGFGLTESSPSSHRNPPDGIRKIGSIGPPLPSTDCKIIDDEGNELPDDTVGELLIKGPQVMKGYWNNAEETKKALKNGWLYTADLAKQDSDGYFYIVGRKVEMIITNGFNVYPKEVENVFYEHPAVHDAAIIGVPDEKSGEIIRAFIVLNEGATVDEEELRSYCYENLTPYKVPKEFRFIDALPRNNVGKILKNKLKEQEV